MLFLLVKLQLFVQGICVFQSLALDRYLQRCCKILKQSLIGIFYLNSSHVEIDSDFERCFLEKKDYASGCCINEHISYWSIVKLLAGTKSIFQSILRISYFIKILKYFENRLFHQHFKIFRESIPVIKHRKWYQGNIPINTKFKGHILVHIRNWCNIF